MIDTAKPHAGRTGHFGKQRRSRALGPFESADPQRLRHLMEVNFFAMVEMTRLAMPLLKGANGP